MYWETIWSMLYLCGVADRAKWCKTGIGEYGMSEEVTIEEPDESCKDFVDQVDINLKITPPMICSFYLYIRCSKTAGTNYLQQPGYCFCFTPYHYFGHPHTTKK